MQNQPKEKRHTRVSREGNVGENPRTCKCFVSLRIRSFKESEHLKWEGGIKDLDWGTKGGTLGRTGGNPWGNHGDRCRVKEGPQAVWWVNWGFIKWRMGKNKVTGRQREGWQHEWGSGQTDVVQDNGLESLEMWQRGCGRRDSGAGWETEGSSERWGLDGKGQETGWGKRGTAWRTWGVWCGDRLDELRGWIEVWM